MIQNSPIMNRITIAVQTILTMLFYFNSSAERSMLLITGTENGHFSSQFPQAIQSEPFAGSDL